MVKYVESPEPVYIIDCDFCPRQDIHTPIATIAAADGIFYCPDCGTAYRISDEAGKDLARYLTACRAGRGKAWLEEHPELRATVVR